MEFCLEKKKTPDFRAKDSKEKVPKEKAGNDFNKKIYDLTKNTQTGLVSF